MPGSVSRISNTRFPAAVASWIRLFTPLSSLIGGMSWKMAKRKPRNSLAFSALMLEHLHAAVPDDDRTGRGAQELGAGRCQVPDAGDPQDRIEIPLSFRGELPVLEPFHPERLHHLHARDGLMEHRRQVGDAFLHQTRFAVHAPADPRDDEHSEREHDERDERQFPADDERDGQVDGDQQRFRISVWNVAEIPVLITGTSFMMREIRLPVRSFVK